MIAALIGLISKYMNKNVAYVLAIIVLTITAIFYVTNYFVSAKELDHEISVVNNKIEIETIKLASEDERIKEDIEQRTKQQQLETLYLRQESAQRQVWDLDNRVDESNDIGKKEKWKRRLERAVEQLKEIVERIEEVKKEK